MNEQRFEISRHERQWAWYSAGIAVVCWSTYRLWAQVPEAGLLALAATAWAIWRLRYAIRPQRYTVVVDEDTISAGDRTLLWTDINGVSFRNGIELLHDWETLARIDSRVENFDKLFDLILPRVTVTSPWLAKSRTVSVDSMPVYIVLGVLGFFLFVFSPRHPWWWLDVVAMIAITIAHFRGLRRIDFDDDGLRLRSVFGETRFIRRADLVSVHLVAGNGRVATKAQVAAAGMVDLSLRKVDPLEVFENARRAYPELVAPAT